MDFITTAIIANSAYDIFKCGLKLSAAKLKEHLSQWIKEDIVAEALATELSKLGLNDEMSELAIARRIEQSQEMAKLICDLNVKAEISAPSMITSVTQHHTGSGDNVAGNKIIR